MEQARMHVLFRSNIFIIPTSHQYSPRSANHSDDTRAILERRKNREFDRSFRRLRDKRGSFDVLVNYVYFRRRENARKIITNGAAGAHVPTTSKVHFLEDTENLGFARSARGVPSPLKSRAFRGRPTRDYLSHSRFLFAWNVINKMDSDKSRANAREKILEMGKRDFEKEFCRLKKTREHGDAAKYRKTRRI